MKPSLVLLTFLSSLALGCGAKSDSAPAANAPEATPTETASETEVETASETASDSSALQIVDIPNAKRSSQGVLAGGQPADAHYIALAEAGYKTVIDLRAAGEPGSEENASRTAAAGMSHIHLPVQGAEGITEETVKAFSEALDVAEGPIVVHCGSGNRVGAMLGMRAFWIEGMSPEASLAIAKESGMTGLEPVVKSLLGLE